MKRSKAALAAIAVIGALALSTSAHAEGAGFDPLGQPRSFFEWIVNLFSSDDGDTGLRIDSNG
jgi:hypothetical protein